MDEITLYLTPEEAKVLNFVVQHIGGDRNGPRGKIDLINTKLNNHYHLFSTADVSVEREMGQKDCIYLK